MRIESLLVALSVAFILEAQGQPADVLPYTVATRLAHETVWHRVEWETNRLGEAVARTNEFVEIATGLNHVGDATGLYEPSREEWEVYADGIVARYGQHKVILATNLNLFGAVDVLLADGATALVSSPVSLGFYDPVDGKQLVIAEVKDCAPEWGAARNEIVFRNCFDRIRGSIRYLYTKAGVHQHVVLEQKLELPEGFSDRSRLECYTVFDAQTPWPQITTRILRSETNPVLRAQMIQPDFMDSELSFGGSMAMRTGKAFSLEEEAEANSIRVGKQFQMIGGLHVLIESVEFKELEPLLARLASVERSDIDGLAINSSRWIKRVKEQARLPAEHFRAWSNAQEIQLASHPLREPAVVIDYELVTSGSNFTFKGDSTYFVSGSVNLSGTTRIEGGAVVKITNAPTAKINVTGTIDCRTGAYRPAIFTSQYDTTVGESIGSGTLTNYPGALVINTTSNALHDLRISYATNGVALGFGEGRIQLATMQFVNCQYPIDSTANDLNEIIVDNGLIVAAKYGIKGGRDLIVRAQHVTAHQCEKFAHSPSGGDSYAYLTNCVFVGVTNWGSEFTFTTNSTVYYATDVTGVFQTVGASSHYLVTGSTNRNAGTTNINATLLAALQKKTTYPPAEITTNITGNTTLSLQVARDTDTLDRGYHYDPIDFVVSGQTVSANLTLTNGVALGVYGTSASYGLGFSSGSLASDGKATDLNWIVRYNTVQEQSTTNWSASSAGPSVKMLTSLPAVRARFTGWSLPAGVNDHYNDTTATTNTAGFMDCQFGGGKLTIYPGSVALTNCLLERVYLTLRDDAENMKWYLFVNTLYGGTLLFKAVASSPVLVARNNFFDRAAITRLSGSEYFTHGQNGYITDCDRLQPTNINDVVLSSLSYASGPLGDFYQAQNDLVAKGNWTAHTWGLYHHTTQTNQVKETNTWLDVGFHYVACVNGQPTDSDDDGLPDYLEDTVGEGSYGLGDLSSWLVVDSDGDCTDDGVEYQQGSNLTDTPQFSSPPVYQILPIGATAVFSATVNQACLSGYQWIHYGTNLVGATNLTLTLTNVQLSSTGLYSLRAYSSTKTNSAAARLVVLDSPAWTIYTNHLAHTNNKSIHLWTNGNPVAWNTNCLLYGKTGYTAISLSNSFSGKFAPVTALTRRHGFTAAHPLTEVSFDGLSHEGTKVWFVTADNQRKEMTNAGAYVRYTNEYDYAIFIFTEDLPTTITPMSVTNPPSSIGVLFRKNQDGEMSANMPPFDYDNDTSRPPFNEEDTETFGDSGSPEMIPTTDGSLVFIRGISTTGALSEQMRKDMDFLCTNGTYNLNLNITNYQLNWHTSYP